MLILVRYCLSSLWPPFIVATGATSFVLNLLFYLKEFIDNLVVYQAGFIKSFLLLIYIQPSFLVLAIPIGFLIALLVVYGRLSADRETVAIQSCGLSLWVLIWPMIVVSALLSLFMVVFMDTLLPWGNTSFLKLEYKIKTERLAVILRERVIIKDFDGYILYVGQKDDRTDQLKNIRVYILDEKNYPYRLILGKEGAILKEPEKYHVILKLTDGIMQQLGTQREQKMDELFQVQFKTCTLDLNARKMKSGPLDIKGASNVSSFKELAQKINLSKSQRADAKASEIEFQKKITLPFAALAFAFIGIPLGLMSRAGSLLGVVFAVGLVTVYDGFIILGENFVPKGLMSPFWAMWLPNLVLIGIGLVLAYRLNHKSDFWRSLLRFKDAKKNNIS
jgi:lipopolysaccharide export system permease protein